MRGPRRPAAAGVASIGVAIGVASLAGYALLAAVGRLLTPADFGLFVAFWGVLFGIGSSLSTVEQETARRVAKGDQEPGPSVAAVTAASAVIAGLAAAVTLLPPVAARLYGRADSRIGLVVVLAALGFAIQFAVRGALIGSHSVRSYSGLVVAEAASRLALLLAIAASVGVTLSSAAVAVAIGSFAWLGWLRRARAVLTREHSDAGQWWHATRRASSLMLAAALTASVITGYPTMVTAFTDSAPGAAGGSVFAALTVSRVPLLLVSPIQALAVPAVVRWRHGASTGARAMLRKVLVGGTIAFAGLAIVGGAVGWLWGSRVVQLVYGPAYDVAPSAVALLVMSAFLLAWVLLMSAAFIALAAYRRMIVMWAGAAVLTALWLFVSPLGVVPTTAIGALVGPLAALAWGIPALWSLMPSGDEAQSPLPA